MPPANQCKHTFADRLAVLFAVFLTAFILSLIASGAAEASYPSLPPTYALNVHSETSDGDFGFTQILSTQNDGVFVYDKDDNRAIVFSNVVFSVDTREVWFSVSGDGIDPQNMYLTINETASENFADIITDTCKIHLALEGIPQIQAN